MSFKSIVGAVFLVAYLAACTTNALNVSNYELNVMDHGAKGDGKTDDREAFMNTWILACNSNMTSTMVIPAGNYSLGPIEFQGPCKATVTVQLEGHLRAPSLLDTFKDSQDGWIVFKNIDGLTLLGGGTFDGQGMTAWEWKEDKCAETGTCLLPTNVRFTYITNGHVRNITSLDSKMFHMSVGNCNTMTFKDITINAPESSPNTDGIHVARSSMINITSTIIRTGDDCISLGDGSQHISISNVTCGPGHGISVGSLGRYRDEQPVVDITVTNCTLVSTMNGVRVKTWPDSFNGVASGLHFQDIIMDNVSNPVIIDQEYCPDHVCKLQGPSKVKVSDVLFKNITGTFASPMAIQLKCSINMPCQNVKLGDINLEYMGNQSTTSSECFYVRPSIIGRVLPPACISGVPGREDPLSPAPLPSPSRLPGPVLSPSPSRFSGRISSPDPSAMLKLKLSNEQFW